VRVALGAACAVFDPAGRILLVRHTYGARNWELPGGGSEEAEDPASTARRELREETGLDVALGRLTGVYFEAAGSDGPMLHAVFRVDWSPEQPSPRVCSPEVDAATFWPVSRLPRPLSTFTAERIRDAQAGIAQFRLVAQRDWLPGDPTGAADLEEGKTPDNGHRG
jgi:8-oxo-dGTP diphosphatase